MVGPEEDHSVCGAVKGLDCLAGGLGEVKVGEVGESVTQLGGKIVARGPVIGVPEDTNIGVQSLQCLSGVLKEPVRWIGDAGGCLPCAYA